MRDKLSGGDPTDLTSARETYDRLRSSTAQQVLRFHRMQQGTTPAQQAAHREAGDGRVHRVTR